MFLSCCQLRFASASYLVNRCFDRYRILDSVLHTFDTADCIRVSLADPFSPECISASLYQDRLCIQTIQREHSRIPAYWDNTYILSFFCCFIYICKILRDLSMCIKAVNGIEWCCYLRSDYRKVCCWSAAEDHYIDIIFHSFHIIKVLYFCPFCLDLYTCRISSCKYCF